MREPSSVDNERIEVANEIIKEVALEYGCEFFDICSGFTDQNGELKQELTKDGVHLNDEGNAVWIEQIEEYIRGY